MGMEFMKCHGTHTKPLAMSVLGWDLTVAVAGHLGMGPVKRARLSGTAAALLISAAPISNAASQFHVQY
jgi:hypothetical protein